MYGTHDEGRPIKTSGSERRNDLIEALLGIILLGGLISSPVVAFWTGEWRWLAIAAICYALLHGP